MRRAWRGLVVAGFFVATYALLVGAVTFVNVEALGFGEAGLELYWPLWCLLYAPAVVAALLAAWYSRLSLTYASALLGVFLALIVVTVEAQWWVISIWPAADGPGAISAELLGLAGAFFIVAQICRAKIVMAR